MESVMKSTGLQHGPGGPAGHWLALFCINKALLNGRFYGFRRCCSWKRYDILFTTFIFHFEFFSPFQEFLYIFHFRTQDGSGRLAAVPIFDFVNVQAIRRRSNASTISKRYIMSSLDRIIAK